MSGKTPAPKLHRRNLISNKWQFHPQSSHGNRQHRNIIRQDWRRPRGCRCSDTGNVKSGRQFAGSIFQATASLRHWSKLTALFGGLVGAGGISGISRMALNVASQRSSAAGLGVTYGEQASFLTNFGRLGNAAGILQGFSTAGTDISKQYALRQYLGHGASGDPAKDFAEGLSRFKTLVISTPKELLGPALRQRGYDS